MKKILSVLLSVVMLICMIPFSAVPVFAEGDVHGLSVARVGGTVTEGKDYEWDGSVLCILEDGLTVSGNTDSERIYVDREVDEVTFDGLSVTVPAAINSDAVAFYGDCKLILKGKNIITNNNGSYSSVYFASYGENEITGEGSLEVSAAHDGIFTEGTLTVSVSGPITVDADHVGITGHSGLYFEKADNDILVYGSNNGAVKWEYELNVAGGLAITGSTDDNADKENITGQLLYDEEIHYLKVGEKAAKSVLVTPIAPDEGHDLIVKQGYSKAVAGTDYAWSSEDSDNLVVLNNGVIVSGETDKEYITVNEYADKLTIRDLSITHSGHDAITFLCNSELKLKGDNTLTITDDAHSAVYFDDDGDSIITGDGNLTVESQCDGIFASGSLAVSSAGAIVINALRNGIFAPYKLEISYDVSKILIYGSDEEFGAVRLGDSFVTAEELTVRGSDVFGADEAAITDEAVCDVEHSCMTVGGNVAKSILISHITFADILDTVSGTYYTQFDQKKGETVTGTTGLTVTVSEDMVCQELITVYNDESYGTDNAFKFVIDNTGYTYWEAETFVNGKPQYGEPDEHDGNDTMANYLSSFISFTEEEEEYVGFAESVIVPAGSYFSEYLYLTFYDVDNGKAQKLWNNDFGLNLERLHEIDMPLGDVFDIVSGTYSGEFFVEHPDSSDSGVVTAVFDYVDENTVCYEVIADCSEDSDTADSARKELIGKDGTTIWFSETVTDGKPVYDSDPIPNEMTIDELMDTLVRYSEDPYESEMVHIPGDNYFEPYLTGLIFYNVENGKAQKAFFESFELDRVPDHEHEFSDVEYVWSGAECTASVSCTGCTETVTETKTGEFKQDTAATCTEPAKGHYEVTFDNADFGTAATAKNSVTSGNSNGHTWTEAKANKAGKSTLKSAATCTADAVYYKVCSVCDAVSETQTWTDAGTAGHKFTGKAVSNGDGTHSFKCTACSAVGTMNGTVAVENGKVNCSGGTATCQSGAVCSACKAVYTGKNPANHVGTANVVKGAVKATCTKGGYTGDTYWSCCQDVLYKKGTTTGTNANNHTDANGDGICDECGKCSKCGGTHESNFWGKIVCFFNRVINWFKNLF